MKLNAKDIKHSYPATPRGNGRRMDPCMGTGKVRGPKGEALDCNHGVFGRDGEPVNQPAKEADR